MSQGLKCSGCGKVEPKDAEWDDLCGTVGICNSTGEAPQAPRVLCSGCRREVTRAFQDWMPGGAGEPSDAEISAAIHAQRKADGVLCDTCGSPIVTYPGDHRRCSNRTCNKPAGRKPSSTEPGTSEDVTEEPLVPEIS